MPFCHILPVFSFTVWTACQARTVYYVYDFSAIDTLSRIKENGDSTNFDGHTRLENAMTQVTKANTQWEQSMMHDGRATSSDSAKYLRGTHTMWCRLFDGELVYTCLPNGETPGPNDGGYRSVDTALTVKGMRTR